MYKASEALELYAPINLMRVLFFLATNSLTGFFGPFYVLFNCNIRGIHAGILTSGLQCLV